MAGALALPHVKADLKQIGLDPKDLPAGALLGIVEVVDILDLDAYRLTPRATPYATGPWCWVLKNPRPLPVTVPATGKLGLWDTADPSSLI